jgi:hypothetical protein
VIAPGPKGDSSWTAVIRSAYQEMRRAYRNGDFSALGERESVLRVGLGYGVNGPVRPFLLTPTTATI